MVTNNSWNSEDPAQVSKGGTGASSLTDNAVLVGSGTDAITPLAVAGEGELLVGAASADPAFGTSADGDFTFTESTAASTRTLSVAHTDDTTGTSNANMFVQTAGASGGDPSLSLQVSSEQTYTFGIDNSSSDDLVITDGASPSAGTVLWRLGSDGAVQTPAQPSFLAVLSTVTNNVTGDGTVFTIICDTESFDQGNDYDNTTGIFTAPVTGNYEFGARATIRFAKAAGCDQYQMIFSKTGTNIDLVKVNPQGVEAVDQFMTENSHTFTTMTAGDTISMAIQASNGTKTVQIVGAGVTLTAFWGRLLP